MQIMCLLFIRSVLNILCEFCLFALHVFLFVCLFVSVKSTVFHRLNYRKCLSKVLSGLQEMGNNANIKSEKNNE